MSKVSQSFGWVSVSAALLLFAKVVLYGFLLFFCRPPRRLWVFLCRLPLGLSDCVLLSLGPSAAFMAFCQFLFAGCPSAFLMACLQKTLGAISRPLKAHLDGQD